MPATIISRSEAAFTLQSEIPYGPSMLDFEEVIPQRLDEAGVLATQGALQQFDAGGSPIQVGDTRLTSGGKLKKEYQTPYGVAPVERHVYQGRRRGGRTCCPINRNARKVRKRCCFSEDRTRHRAITYSTIYSDKSCWPTPMLRVEDEGGVWQRRTPATAAGLADHVGAISEWLTRPAVHRKWATRRDRVPGKNEPDEARPPVALTRRSQCHRLAAPDRAVGPPEKRTQDRPIGVIEFC